MAQVVDTKGKTKAAPSGKLMDGDKAQKSTSKEAVNTIVDDAVNSVVNAISNIKIKSSAPSVSKKTSSVSKKNSVQNKNSVHKQNNSSNAPNALSSPYTGISGGIPVVRNQSSEFSSTTPSMIASAQKPSSSNESEIPFSEKPVKDNSYNEIYEKDMLDSGMSQDYLDMVLKEPDTINAALDNTNELDPKWRKDLLNQLTTSVDDGTLDRPHLLSDTMTGKQYYHYVHDLGMPGMPEDEIDVGDNSKYSKSEQRQMYGFPYYVPNDVYELGMSIPNLASATRTLSDYITNVRSRGFLNDVDYQMTTDTGYGDQTFSGREYDRKSPGYLSQTNLLYDKANNGDIDAISTLTKNPKNDYYTTMVHQYEFPDGSRHYGVITGEDVELDVGSENNLWDLTDVDEDHYRFDENGIPTSFTTKDGFDLNLSFDPMTNDITLVEDDAYRNWLDSHQIYRMNFSDGSSWEAPLSDVFEMLDSNNGEIYKPNDWVSYDSTNLDDLGINQQDVMNLTVGKPSKLGDSYKESGAELGAYYSPDMVLSDGTRISYDVARKLAEDTNPDDSKDDGIYYNFQPSGLNPLRLAKDNGIKGLAEGLVGVASNPILGFTSSKPRRLMHQEPFDEEGFHWKDLPNNMADWAAGSTSISLPVYQWVDALSKTLPYFSGVEAQSRSENGRYNSTGYDSGSDENAIMAVPTLFGPALENLAGKFGHESWLDKLVKPMIDSRFPQGTFSNLTAHQLYDMFGEGLEEVIGNVTDEPGTYGLKNMFADPISQPYAGMGRVYDDDNNLIMDIDDNGIVDFYDNDGGVVPRYDSDGNRTEVNISDLQGPFPVMVDEYGREFRDSDTPVLDRVGNALAPTPEHFYDTVNAALGGAGVSALYNFPSLLVGGYDAWRQKKNARDLGVDKDANDVKNDIIRRDKEFEDKFKIPESLSFRPGSRSMSSDRIPYDPEDYIIEDDAPIR